MLYLRGVKSEILFRRCIILVLIVLLQKIPRSTCSLMIASSNYSTLTTKVGIDQIQTESNNITPMYPYKNLNRSYPVRERGKIFKILFSLSGKNNNTDAEQ